MNAEAMEFARRELEQRRSRSKILQAQRVEEISVKIPQVMDVRKELSMTSVRLSKMILSHQTGLSDGLEQLKESNLRLQAREKELLRNGGYPDDYLELRHTCPRCQDTGFVEGKPCACFQELVRQYAMRELNAVSSMELCSFDTFRLEYYSDRKDPVSEVVPRENMAKILDFCKLYAKAFTLEARSLFFTGSTGLGKTHLSLAIAREVAEKGYNVAYGSASDFLRAIEDEHFGRVENRQTMDGLLEADLLIFDDLGAEFSTSFSAAAIYNLINTRSVRRKPTIISSNLTSKELGEKYSQRVVSRLYQFVYLRFVGKDIRQVKTAQKGRAEHG